MKYMFVEAPFEGRSFFTVTLKAGEIFIRLNTLHPAYKHLVEVLETEEVNASPDELRQRLENASRGLKLLLMAWARYEDEQITDKARGQLQDIRYEWGRVAGQFLEDREQ